MWTQKCLRNSDHTTSLNQLSGMVHQKKISFKRFSISQNVLSHTGHLFPWLYAMKLTKLVCTKKVAPIFVSFIYLLYMTLLSNSSYLQLFISLQQQICL